MEAYPWKWFLFSIEGRISRFDYWVRFTLPVLAVTLISVVAEEALAPDGNEYLTVANAGINLLIFWPSIAVSAKRLHDRGLTAMWMLPMFVAMTCTVAAVYVKKPELFLPLYVVGALIALWLLVEMSFFRGTDGDNRFGPDPLARPSIGAP